MVSLVLERSQCSRGTFDIRIRKFLEWGLMIAQVWSILQELRGRRKIIFHLLETNASIPSHCLAGYDPDFNTALLSSLYHQTHLCHLSPLPPIHMSTPLLSAPPWASPAKVLASSWRASVPFAASLFSVCPTISTPPPHFSGSMAIQRIKLISPKLFNIAYQLGCCQSMAGFLAFFFF